MIYHFNKLSKYTKQEVIKILKNELVELEEAKKNKNYIELSSQNSATLGDSIGKGLYILRNKASHEKNRGYIELNKRKAHFILF